MTTTTVERVYADPRYTITLPGRGTPACILNEDEALDVYRQLGELLGERREPGLEDVLTQTQLEYDGVVRMGYVIGLSTGRTGQLVQFVETWNFRDGYHVAPLFKNLKVDGVTSSRKVEANV